MNKVLRDAQESTDMNKPWTLCKKSLYFFSSYLTQEDMSRMGRDLYEVEIASAFLFYKIRNRGFLKNRQNGEHAEGTAAGVSFCLPGVQRAGSPLCQECKGWQHLAGVKGQSP